MAWCLADPKLGEREVAAELLAHARDLGTLRDAMIVLADKGLAGRELERYAEDQLKALLVRPDRKDERRRFANLAGRGSGSSRSTTPLKARLAAGTIRRANPAGCGRRGFRLKC